MLAVLRIFCRRMSLATSGTVQEQLSISPGSTVEVKDSTDRESVPDVATPPSAILSRKRFPSPDLQVPERRKKIKADEEKLDRKRFEGVKYYFENGLRKVEPYYFTWRTYAKGRWIGRSVKEVFREEFFSVCEEVTKSRLFAQPSNIFINGIRVDIDTKIKNNDYIAHYTHRHEQPVSDQAIKIVAETADMLVVDKPASIPAHPCGRFRMNSVLYILAYEQQLFDLRLVHRLDRLTSGLMIFAKNLAASQAVMDQMLDRSVQKEYLCQVAGRFPTSTVVCQDPIDCINKRIGVLPSGKECITEFDRLAYDSDANTSIVHCRPKTGRTHQIRVHLQHLGYPIINDPIYGPNPRVDTSTVLTTDGDADGHQLMDLVEDRRVQFSKLEELPRFDWVDEDCPECWIDFVDPTADELRIDLHCWKYEGPGWKFETELPVWARDVVLRKVADEVEIRSTGDIL